MDTGEPAGSAAAAAGGDKREALLREITEEGGFAFVASAEKAASGDLRAAEAAREMAWEQLHSGPWNEVGPAWRDAYALACLHVASLRTGDDRRAALRALDMGLIMGGDLLRAELEAAIARVPSDGDRDSNSEGNGDTGRHGEMWREGLGRNRDLADVLKVLPVKSLSCKQIERRTCISLEAFIHDFFLRESPVILSGCIDHWPARTKWKDIKYLERIAGDRTVPVEVGKNYVSNEWRQDLITFSQFLERMWSPDCSANLTYLAQHQLFDQIKELREDIVVPDYCYAGGGELQSLNAWFGPHGTVTPLHHDPHHNLFAQTGLQASSYGNEHLIVKSDGNWLSQFEGLLLKTGHQYKNLSNSLNLERRSMSENGTHNVDRCFYPEKGAKSKRQYSFEPVSFFNEREELIGILCYLHAQIKVLGRKYIRLYHASISEDLYPHMETMLRNTSQVDLDNIDVNEFPRTEGLEFMDSILEEGDLLYIPPKWWHYVRSLSISFSVSFWWRTSILPSQGS